MFTAVVSIPFSFLGLEGPPHAVPVETLWACPMSEPTLGVRPVPSVSGGPEHPPIAGVLTTAPSDDIENSLYEIFYIDENVSLQFFLLGIGKQQLRA